MNRQVLGFDRTVNIDWLDYTASKVMEGCTKSDVREHLFNYLEGVVAGGRKDSARVKTITVLSRIWSNVPIDSERLKLKAIDLLTNAGPSERLAIHWAMVSGSYVFFNDVATAVGRVLELQENVTQAQLVRRMQELWGDRSTLIRATQRAMRSMVEWGTLLDTDKKGVCKPIGKRIEVGPNISQLLAHSLLIHQDGQALPIESIARHPGFYPFKLNLTTYDLRESPLFEVHRQGLDVDVVQLAQS